MANDPETNDFIRDCVLHAAVFRNKGHDKAAATLLYSAERAIRSPRETAPLSDYARDIAGAILDVFGWNYDLADTSHRLQIKAAAMWSWYTKAFGADVPRSLHAAIEVMDAAGPEWREKIYEILAKDHERLHMQRERSKLQDLEGVEW